MELVAECHRPQVYAWYFTIQLRDTIEADEYVARIEALWLTEGVVPTAPTTEVVKALKRKVHAHQLGADRATASPRPSPMSVTCPMIPCRSAVYPDDPSRTRGLWFESSFVAVGIGVVAVGDRFVHGCTLLATVHGTEACARSMCARVFRRNELQSAIGRHSETSQGTGRSRMLQSLPTCVRDGRGVHSGVCNGGRCFEVLSWSICLSCRCCGEGPTPVHKRTRAGGPQLRLKSMRRRVRVRTFVRSGPRHYRYSQIVEEILTTGRNDLIIC